jgi:ATP-dependent DNA ligase
MTIPTPKAPKPPKPFKPMLAHTVDVMAAVQFPVLASPKLDGIRCIIRNGEAVSRSLKPIPNKHIRDSLRGLPDMDGELTIGDETAEDCFKRSTSGVMAHGGEPDFAFRVFDAPDLPSAPFTERKEIAKRRASAGAGTGCAWLSHRLIADAAELAAYEAEQVAAGYEGIMLRAPDGVYKFGRSTLRAGILGKVKRFTDAEAVIIGVEELLRNENEAKTNALGRSERSTSKAGKVPGGTMGKLIVRAAGFEDFGIGTGFTAQDRAEIWDDRSAQIGRLVKFKFQACGTDARPRLPVFLGFRDPADMAA